MAVRLRTLLGDHPCTEALKRGSIRSDLVEFDFATYSPTNKGFKPMVREGAFDVSEMAIVTYLMAKSFGKPMVLVPDRKEPVGESSDPGVRCTTPNGARSRRATSTASASVSALSPPPPGRGCAAFSPMITASISIRSTV